MSKPGPWCGAPITHGSMWIDELPLAREMREEGNLVVRRP
jgi:hypothetical protein